MGKTINQALKDLFLSLGGESSALADNTSVSDYIADLESAIKATAAAELPEVAAANDGQVLAVKDGKWTLCEVSAVADTTSGAVTITFTPVTSETT